MTDQEKKTIPNIAELKAAKIAEEKQKFEKPNTGTELPSKREYFILDCARSGQAGDARLFIDLFLDKYCYDHAAGQWYRWKNHYWVDDEIDRVMSDLEEVIESYSIAAQQWAWRENAATKAGDKELIKEAAGNRDTLLKKIKKLQNKGWRRDVLVMAASGEKSLGISGKEWDSNPYLIGCSNGVYDLENNFFRDGDPDDYIKTICPTEWKGLQEPAPKWEKFLYEIFEGHQEKINYVQRLLGYGAAGLTEEHVIPIFTGKGRNGKGTKIETLNYVLGQLSGPIQSEMLLEQFRPRASAGPSADIMTLQGKRLVWASETDEGRKLNAGKVKWLCGGDTLIGRHPYGKREITFQPTHTVFLLTNHKPKIDPDDFALWERIHVIEFRLSFVNKPTEIYHRKQNPKLPKQLKKEASGILAWLVRGFLAWQQEGLNPPEEVLLAVKNYRANEDDLQRFIDECCVIGNELKTQAKTLFSAYEKWCDENGYKKIWQNIFKEKMGCRFERDDTNKRKIFYKGIGILSE